MKATWALFGGSQRSTNPDNVPTQVVATVCEALIAGKSVPRAVEEALATGFNCRESLQALAVDLTRSPFLPLARVAYARLESREWILNAHRILEGNQVVVDKRWPLTAQEFQQDYYLRNRPVCCSGAANAWPAVAKWGKEYLASVAGAAAVDVMMGRDSAPVQVRAATDQLKQTISFAEFIERCWQSTTNDFYLVGTNDFFSKDGTAALAQDVGPLSFVRTDCANGAVKLWVGPAGTFTSFHYDSRNNVMVQIVGTKRVHLVPPQASEFMRQISPWYAGCDPLRDDNETPPPYACIDLKPGDALFLPVGWWHSVEALAPSVTVTCTDFGLANSYEKPPVSLVSQAAPMPVGR